jgi:hypothetical protein
MSVRSLADDIEILKDDIILLYNEITMFYIVEKKTLDCTNVTLRQNIETFCMDSIADRHNNKEIMKNIPPLIWPPLKIYFVDKLIYLTKLNTLIINTATLYIDLDSTNIEIKKSNNYSLRDLHFKNDTVKELILINYYNHTETCKYDNTKYKKININSIKGIYNFPELTTLEINTNCITSDDICETLSSHMHLITSINYKYSRFLMPNDNCETLINYCNNNNIKLVISN